MNVPAYPVGSVQNAPMPGVRFSPDATPAAFGAADAVNAERVGQVVGQIGDAAFEVAQQRQKQVNDSQVRDAFSHYETAARDKYTNDFSQRRDETALNMVPEAEKFHDELRDKTLENLPNQYQKNLFAEMEPHFRAAYIYHVQNAQMHQQEAFTKRSLAFGSNTALQTGVQFANDPKVLTQSEKTIAGNAVDLGRDPEVEVSHLYESAAKGLSEQPGGGPNQALAFLSKYQGKIQPTALDKLRSDIEAKASKFWIAGTAQQIASAPGMTEANAVAAVDKMDMPDEKKTPLLEAVHTQMGIRKSAEDKQALENTKAAWNKFYENPSLDTIAGLPVDATEQNKMHDALRNMSKEHTQDEQSATYGSILQEISKNPNALKTMNLWQYNDGRLSSHDFKFLQEEQQKVISGKGSPNFQAGLKQATQRMDNIPSIFDTSAAAGADQDRNQKRRNSFLAEFQNRLDQIPDPKRNDVDVVNDLVDSMLKDTVIKTHWFWPDEKWTPSPKEKLPWESSATNPGGQPADAAQPAPAPTADDIIQEGEGSPILAKAGKAIGAMGALYGDEAKQLLGGTVGPVAKVIKGKLDEEGQAAATVEQAKDMHSRMKRAGIDTSSAKEAYDEMVASRMARPATARYIAAVQALEAAELKKARQAKQGQ